MEPLDLRNSELLYFNYLIARTLTGIGVVEDSHQHLSSVFPCLNGCTILHPSTCSQGRPHGKKKQVQVKLIDDFDDSMH